MKWAVRAEGGPLNFNFLYSRREVRLFRACVHIHLSVDVKAYDPCLLTCTGPSKHKLGTLHAMCYHHPQTTITVCLQTDRLASISNPNLLHRHGPERPRAENTRTAHLGVFRLVQGSWVGTGCGVNDDD